jgi:hypothetical protein
MGGQLDYRLIRIGKEEDGPKRQKNYNTNKWRI